MKANMILTAIISLVCCSFPHSMRSLVYDAPAAGSSKAIAGLQMRVNGAPAKGTVFALKGTEDEIERVFLEMNASGGFVFEGRKQEILQFSKGSVSRSAAVLKNKYGATGVCFDAESKTSEAKAASAAVMAGIEPPPGSDCVLCLTGRNGSFQAVYRSGDSADSLGGYFASLFRGNGWSLAWSGNNASGSRAFIFGRGKEWCFVSLSGGACVISYGKDRRNDEKQ